MSDQPRDKIIVNVAGDPRAGIRRSASVGVNGKDVPLVVQQAVHAAATRQRPLAR
jgi:hypothetical protein